MSGRFYAVTNLFVWFGDEACTTGRNEVIIEDAGKNTFIKKIVKARDTGFSYLPESYSRHLQKSYNTAIRRRLRGRRASGRRGCIFFRYGTGEFRSYKA